MTNSVPDRWLEYKAFGGVIKGTKILAFKVPLKDAIARNLKPEQRFTIQVLRQAFPHLKCIIDLTNTCRYYDGKEFTNAGIKYEKIAIPGRKIPTMDIIETFFKVMDDFMSTCSEGDLIGVHCTHGVNRTGYLICRYLIQQQGWETQDSLKAFEEARGYPVERDIYLSALKEVQRGKKIDTSKTIMMPTNPTIVTKKNSLKIRSSLKNLTDRSDRFSVGPPTFSMSRRGFANGGPFSSQRFAGPPTTFGHMPPPPPDMPPISPPHMGPHYLPYGPRPFRYGAPPMRPMSQPPCFPHPSGFPSCIPGPPRMPSLRRPSGTRLPLKMPPPLPPPPPLSSSRTSRAKQLQQKQNHIRNGIMERAVNMRLRRNGPTDKVMSKVHKEQDFTVDTFEENLATSASTHLRRPKRRFSRTK
ncbi:hypothetical protein DMN91_002109 [Ooceraea biroi]|uniref:Tyrosine specific protein phosphatases domain-containing protein n=1 Tax=Ooceraea biroi TaxID=2015173 RepID=A0A3L8E008_OOCBI|nr:RNA/RNP complex-1-interacting phosphatase isoform X2 [Ooceraea biroi]RLU25946.1 hypothetical protein DMN91_002109 [Ooceraea biroi]